MATRMNGSLRLCLAGAAIVAFAPVPAARAQWLPPWGGASPGEIVRSLEAQGYGLIAPLVRRPGIYLADVSAGAAGYQRLVVDAISGQILERFVAPGRMWGPTLAARNEEFGEPQPSGVGPPLNPGFSGRPAIARPWLSAPRQRLRWPPSAKRGARRASLQGRGQVDAPRRWRVRPVATRVRR
jgi:hypothetical protein